MIYSIPNSDKNIRSQFTRRLYSQKVRTHQGKYTHKTKGILDEFRKPANACIIFSINKLNEVKKLCEKYLIDAKFYKIEKFT